MLERRIEGKSEVNIKKVRFLEPGHPPYKKTIKNLYTYEAYIRTPSTGLMTLTTIVKEVVDDTRMYSESISKIDWEDVLDGDIVCIGIFTFAATRGYELARYIKENSRALVVMGGLHASMNYPEAVEYCDYVLLGEGDESLLRFIRALKADEAMNFPGLAYMRDGTLVCTGDSPPPLNIDVIPDRYLLHNYHKMAGHNTIWAQVHASRGCPHHCSYCAVARHFGHSVRTRSVENVIEDIRQAIAFHENRVFRRLNHVLWITDDNFFADRDWAIRVLQAIIDSGIRYRFTIQARYEVGLDDEMLELLKRAGFFELAMGIEFLDDKSFASYHKSSSYQEIVRSVQNIQRHGLNVRGLFIFGSDEHEKGIGKRLADFVEKYDIRGVLIQSMYFIPGTPVYEANKDRLLLRDWSKSDGHVVHYPKKMSPHELQEEIIIASRSIYSLGKLWRTIFSRNYDLLGKVLFIGEYFWQKSIRKNLSADLNELKAYGKIGEY